MTKHQNISAMCLRCGGLDLCDAHIIPAALAKDAASPKDKKLFLMQPDRKGVSQSGEYDPHILCSQCDNILGLYDKHAITILRLLGTESESIDHASRRFTLAFNNLNHERLALFGAAVVWRSSVSKRIPDFTLGSNEDWFKEIVFRDTGDLPVVNIFRVVSSNPSLHQNLGGFFSYPVKRQNEENISFAEFYVRGFKFVVKTSRQKSPLWEAGAITELGKSAGPNKITGALLQLEDIGEIKGVNNSRYMQEKLSPLTDNLHGRTLK